MKYFPNAKYIKRSYHLVMPYDALSLREFKSRLTGPVKLIAMKYIPYHILNIKTNKVGVNQALCLTSNKCPKFGRPPVVLQIDYGHFKVKKREIVGYWGRSLFFFSV